MDPGPRDRPVTVAIGIGPSAGWPLQVCTLYSAIRKAPLVSAPSENERSEPGEVPPRWSFEPVRLMSLFVIDVEHDREYKCA